MADRCTADVRLASIRLASDRQAQRLASGWRHPAGVGLASGWRLAVRLDVEGV
jgi:hypothetical protein